MKKHFLQTVTLTMCIALFSVTQLSAQKAKWIFNYKIANTSEELAKIMDDPKSNIIRSKKDFRLYVQTNAKLAKAFQKKGLLKTVASTMKFNERGLKTFSFAALAEAYPKRYKDLLSELTPGFGFEMETLGVDYEGYACTGPATCETSQRSICIGNNC